MVTTTRLKPHIGASGVPFMNKKSLFSFTRLSIASFVSGFNAIVLLSSNELCPNTPLQLLIALQKANQQQQQDGAMNKTEKKIRNGYVC
eukprot:m.55954 g.55954  ORF g.55954 m.55954 type:complete len:89 (+) comp7780_c0_seq2:1742-2008(+)